MDEKLRFVARLLEGEKMAVLCREYDISRKTGYKIFNRYKASGLEGLTDRSRRPYRQDCQLRAAWSRSCSVTGAISSLASNPSAKAPRTMITRYNAPPVRAYACGEASTA